MLTRKKTFQINKIFTSIATGLLLCVMLTCCAKEPSAPEKAAPYDGKEYLQESELTAAGEDPDSAFDSYTVINNYDSALSVPTYVTKADDLWFIVDCYHNRIIYTDSLGIPLNEWKIMCDQATQPHTMASDGIVYLVEDTENNRVLVFEKRDNKFINTQSLYEIGNRPHFTVYDETSDTFYVWSSSTGELYCFRHKPEDTRMYLTEIRKIDQLSGLYVRSFTIVGDDIYFVSGVSATGADAQILKCDLKTLNIKKSYPVPDELAGMVQITPIDDMFYITVSTDITGNQDYATLIRTSSLDKLSKGDYEDIYAKYFVGGGTPYNISKVDDTYFLTEHRLQGHSIWSFKVESGEITDVTALY